MTYCNASREKGLNCNAPVLEQPPLVSRILTELIELDCSSEASGNESSPIGVPPLTTRPVVSGHSIGNLHFGDRVMVTSSQGSNSSAINVSASSDGLGQQGATDSMGEALATGQLATLQTLENETHFSSSNMYATGRNGCMGLNGCAQPPTHLLSCPHRRVGRRMCSNKCLIRIPFDERCLCENEDFDDIRPVLVEIYD